MIFADDPIGSSLEQKQKRPHRVAFLLLNSVVTLFFFAWLLPGGVITIWVA